MNAMAWYRLGRRLRDWNLGFLASIADAISYLLFGCAVPSHAKIGRGTTIEHRGIAVVINRQSVIGRDCHIGPQVVVGGRGKNIPGCPRIGDGVYLGAGSKILGPITVGDGAIVGANSVVLKDVPPGATVVGIPGRILSRE